MRILIAEDEKDLAGTLKKNFKMLGFDVTLVYNGNDAIDTMIDNHFDLLLLDWRMPGKSGLDVCKAVRRQKLQTPIILLTALSDISNKVEALNAGADDYITKPFAFNELVARVKAVTRRTYHAESLIYFYEYQLDLINHVVRKSSEELKLTEKEFELLYYFIQNKNKIVNKETLAKDVWQLNFYPTTNYIEATVKNLRKKLEEFTGQKFIKTVYGEGYSFVE